LINEHINLSLTLDAPEETIDGHGFSRAVNGLRLTALQAAEKFSLRL
jgi:hypothetical protein